MKILDNTVTAEELAEIAAGRFGDLVKAVVDVDRQLIAIDAELHSDLEALLLESGSKQGDLWGINLYPKLKGEDFVEFDSIINMRPSRGNTSRGVENRATQNKIIGIVNKWIKQ
jgi:hypothetical protein